MMVDTTESKSLESLYVPDETSDDESSDGTITPIFNDPQLEQVEQQIPNDDPNNDLENPVINVHQDGDTVDNGNGSNQFKIPDLEPQEKLLWALQNDMLDEFLKLLKHPKVNAHFKYSKPKVRVHPSIPSYHPEFGTCIEIACRYPDRGYYVKALLDHGVKPNVNIVCPEPIHYAARDGNPDALKVLLQDKRTKVNALDSYDRTALHNAIKYSKKGREKKYDQCIVMLLECHDLDINKPNKKGYTAIHEAANLHSCIGKKVIELFLKYRTYDLDLDNHRGNGRTARDAINMKYPELKGVLPELNRQKICDINTQLLTSLENRQLSRFRKLLRQVDDDGNARLDPNYVYGHPHNATCLQIACKENDCAEYVKELLNAGSNPNIKDSITEQAPLHIAAGSGNYKVLLELLKNRRTNINIVNREGMTVLHIIAAFKSGKTERKNILKCLQIILQTYKLRSQDIAIQVNLHDNYKNTAAEIALRNNSKDILEKMIHYAGNRMDVDSKMQSTGKTLREAICHTFPDLGNKFPIRRDVSKIDICATLFQCLYDRKTNEFIQVFQSTNQSDRDDFNDGNYTLLQYAVHHCMKDEVKELLSAGINPNNKTDYEKRPPLIIATVSKYDAVLKLLLELEPLGRLDINGTDAKGNTALHYAAKNGDLECIVDLLQHGADFCRKNIFGKPPLTADAVQNFFDNSLKPNDKFPDDEDYELIFDYNFLLAHKEQHLEKYSPQNQEHTRIDFDTNEQCHHLSFETHKPEMNFLFYISSSKEHCKLMIHPIVTSFLHIKWNRVKFAFYINLFIYSIFVILLNTHILLKVGEDGQSESNLMKGIFEKIAMICLPLFLVFFLFREVFQFVLSPSVYIKNYENIIDLGLIIFTGWMLLDWQPYVIVTVILLSCSELILLTGRWPKLSKNIEMLKTVSKNYCWFLFSYIFLIIAFAFCFYSILHEDAIKEKNNNTIANKTENEKESHYGFYMHPLLSIERTFIMMMGEFEIKDLLSNMESFHTCFWLFSLFVFVIAMILLNLLTGLAVNDTQTIKANAEQLSLISRIKLIYEIEKNCLEWYRFLETCQSCRLLFPFRSMLKNVLKNIILFPMFNKKICIQPNKGPAILFEGNATTVKCEMDVKILRKAMQIISNHDKEKDFKQSFDEIQKIALDNYETVFAKLQTIEETLRQIQNDRFDIKEILDSINNKLRTSK